MNVHEDDIKKKILVEDLPLGCMCGTLVMAGYGRDEELWYV